MRGFEKFILCLFSIIMIILSVFFILVSTSMIQVADLYDVLIGFLVANKLWVLVVGAVISLLGLIGLFSSSDSSDESRSGLAIKNESGTVFLNRDTFESMIMSVARNYPELVNPKVDVTISEDGVKANIYALILPDTVVPTLSSKLQENIKTVVKKQTTIDIKEANVKIKGVYMEPQKKVN
jgi:uncharacterized alkaline shock family protein YloU